MRLINTHTLKLESHHVNRFSTPPYAILSHTWDFKEVTLPDMGTLTSEELQEHPGFKKLYYTCLQAKKDGYSHAWIDSCCIDKNSSAELSEAINSMFEWYSRAEVCYAYLSDVKGSIDPITGSRWFTRGWTLQELLAPKVVRFYDYQWKYLGTSDYLINTISDITGIAKPFLSPKARPRLRLEAASVAQRMSWAAKRQTTRVEDEAYSLLGIFNVNMPLLYGEGKRAFVRLQEEIMKITTDHSLFVWDRSGGMLLATSPRGFYKMGNVICAPGPEANQPFTLTNAGLKIRLPVTYDDDSGQFHCLLNCQYDDDELTERVALRIEGVHGDVNSTNSTWTWRFKKPFRLKKSMQSKWTRDQLTFRHSESIPEMTVIHALYPHFPQISETEFDDMYTPKYFIETEFKIAEVHPYRSWNEEKRCLSRHQANDGVLGIFILKRSNSCLGMVLMEQDTSPELPPTVFITGVIEPVQLWHLALGARRARSFLRSTGVWQGRDGDFVYYTSERHHRVVTWLQKITVGNVSSHISTIYDSNLNTDVLMSAPRSELNSGVPEPRLVMALQYDTTWTGFAYATPHGPESKLKDIEVFTEWTTSRISSKVPSVIAYHNDEIQWGWSLSGDAVPIDTAKLNLTLTALPEEPHTLLAGEKRPVEIVTDFLTMLSRHLSMNLDIFSDHSLKHRDTDFVIVVPGYWSYEALESLFEAVNSSFMLQVKFPRLRNILSISETEAAAMYTVRSLVENQFETELEKGDTFILCEANDDRTDVVSYKIKSSHPIELEQAGALRARAFDPGQINGRFLSWLKTVLGEHFDHLNLESRELRRLKARFDKIKVDFNNLSRDAYLELPFPLDNLTLPEFVNDGLLTIPHDTMAAFFDPVVQETLELIQSQIVQLEGSGDRPKVSEPSRQHVFQLIEQRIIMIGSSAESMYLEDAVKVAFFELQDIRVYLPRNAWTAAVRGAVLYGIEKEGLGRALRRLEPLPI